MARKEQFRAGRDESGGVLMEKGKKRAERERKKQKAVGRARLTGIRTRFPLLSGEGLFEEEGRTLRPIRLNPVAGFGTGAGEKNSRNGGFGQKRAHVTAGNGVWTGEQRILIRKSKLAGPE